MLLDTPFHGEVFFPEQPRAILIVVHGLAEHSGRYADAMAALANRGVATYVYDQRGHGAHATTLGHADNFADYADDLEALGQAVQREHPEIQIFIWGHSMGAVVVALAALDRLNWARGVITSGCAIDAFRKLAASTQGLMRIGSALLPKLRVRVGIDPARLTHSVELQQAYRDDPLIFSKATLRLLYGFSRACESVAQRARSISKPWLAVHGAEDRVAPASGSRKLIARLGSKDKRLEVFPGLRHELHHESDVDREVLFDLMTQWIAERVDQEV